AGEEAGGRSEERTDRDADRGGDESDRERDARAVDDATQYVAAEPVRAEQILTAWRQEAGTGNGILCDGIVWRDERRKQRDQIEQHDDAETDQRELVPTELACCDRPLRVAPHCTATGAHGQVPERPRPEQ